MRAVCWHGSKDVGVDRVADPALLNHRDAVIRVTATAIRGSQLPVYDGYVVEIGKETLDDAPGIYKTFRDKEDDCIKVGMRP